MTINQVKQYFSSLTMNQIPNAIEQYKNDSRVGVKNICNQYEKKYNQYLAESNRINNMKDFDRVFNNSGQYTLAGVDEAGRGPLAGPVVAAAVILPLDVQLPGINDSKQISQNKREILYDIIIEKAIEIGIGIIDNCIIDEINILNATLEAMKAAVTHLKQVPEVVLIDGDRTIPSLPSTTTQHAVIKGDSKSIAIAAASIIAKVTRDRMMADYHTQYPYYEFDQNKGYGSLTHQQALKIYGPCPIHRKTFLRR